MTESPEAYAERVLAYCLKAKKPVELSDPNLERQSQVVTKAVEEPKPHPIDVMFDAYTKAQSTPALSLEEYTAKILKEMQEK